MKPYTHSFITLFRTLAILSLLAAAGGCVGEQEEKTAGSPGSGERVIAIGMSFTEFQNIYPEAVLSADGQWEYEASLHGVDGTWIYSFSNRRLSWFVFNAYEPEISSETFQLCLEATRRLIGEYSMRYGKPAEEIRGIEQYRDPKLLPHAGYSVLEAKWAAESSVVEVQFHFMGDKDQYRFFVTVGGHAA